MQAKTESLGGSPVNPALVVIVPATGSFPPALPRLLFDSCPVARRVFIEAMDQPGMPSEPDFFALYEGSESGEAPTALDKQQRSARMVFLVALYRHLEAVLGVEVQPAAVLGNSLGFLTGLVITGAVGLADAMRLWSLLWDQSEAMYAERKFCSMMVTGIQPRQVRRYALESHGLPKLFYVSPGPVSYLCGEFDRLVKMMVMLEKHPPARAEICGGIQRAPFHLRSFGILRKREIEQIVSTIDLDAPTIPIYSTIPDRGRIDEPAEIQQALLHLLFNPFRWDRMLEQLISDGIERVLCLGFDSGNDEAHLLSAETVPVTEMSGVRAVTAAFRDALGGAKVLE